MKFAVAAYAAPFIEAILARSVVGGMDHRHSAGEANLLARFHAHRISAAGSHTLAFPNRDQGCVAIGIDIETIVASFQNSEGGVGCVDFIHFAVEQARHLQVQSALIELHLYRAVTEIGESEAGLAVHAHGGAAQMQFGTRVFVRPQAVGCRHRTVDSGGGPVVDSSWLHGHLSADVLETGDARRWIVGE
jgi:hypothetical protein